MQDSHLPVRPVGFLVALERFLAKGGRAALTAALVASALPACAPAADESADTADQALIGNGAKDWAQREGQRDTSMVSYYGENWSQSTDCYSRGGCAGVDVFFKLRVKPVVGAQLDKKRVGIVYRQVDSGELVTTVGSYFSTWGNGDEEWHVKVHLRSWQSALSFDAWYQDGAGKTYYDDNNGGLHAFAGRASPAIYLNYTSNLTVDRQSGVRGTIRAELLDFGYDKDVELVWTTDAWKTVNKFGSGEGKNHWHWAGDGNDSHESWAIDLDIPQAGVDRFEYALVYRHGVNPGDRTYEFWANNDGYNYRADAR